MNWRLHDLLAFEPGLSGIMAQRVIFRSRQ
jgi:hypothetical protein